MNKTTANASTETSLLVDNFQKVDCDLGDRTNDGRFLWQHHEVAQLDGITESDLVRGKLLQTFISQR